jgi:hypothetical protein
MKTEQARIRAVIHVCHRRLMLAQGRMLAYDQSSDDEVEINEEELDKLLEEGTGGMGNTNDAVEADK